MVDVWRNTLNLGRDAVTLDIDGYHFYINQEESIVITTGGIEIRGNAITLQGANIGLADGCGYIHLEGNGSIISNGDLRICLDANRNQDAKLSVCNDSGAEVFNVNEQGRIVMIQGGAIVLNVVQDGFIDEYLRLGGERGRGRIAIRSKPLEGQARSMPGILVLYDAYGKDYYLWVDTQGVLRISNSDPGGSDASGTAVGDQQGNMDNG